MASSSPMRQDSSKLITCILPKGAGKRLIRMLKESKDLATANFNTARGSGMSQPYGEKGIGQTMEKDIVTIVVPKPKSEDIFEFIYHDFGVNKAHGGFMYMGDEIRATRFVLPDLPMEK